MDVHRDFAQIAMVEDGFLQDAGQIGCRPEELQAWAETLRADDEVALEATGNSEAIALLLRPKVARVVVSNPHKTRAIAEAKVKTDKVDARILAQLLAADFLPPVWLPDDRTSRRRRLIARRMHVVRQRTRIKNQVQSILHRNLMPRPPVSDAFGTRGRAWLQHLPLPDDEREAVDALLRQLDFHGGELAELDRKVAVEALDDPDIRRLMTIPGVDVNVALSVVAAVGDFARFRSADKLVAYFGLNPRVRQSGGLPAATGRITKTGRSQVRGMLVEAAWVASRSPGPLRAFYERIKSRRGIQVAIVATARKMTTLCWHLITKGEDYAFARPSLVAFKRRKLQLQAGAERRIARRGMGYEYNDKILRRHEREIVEQQERAYAVFAAHWQSHRPAPDQQSSSG
nr:IS110 family transposase [Streptomyces albicerus]